MLMNKKKKKKMMMMKKLPSLFFKSSTDDKSTWPWPPCRQPRTLSFRTNAATATDSSDSFFTLSSESSGSLSTASDLSGGDPIERMIRGLRSERLLFEPAGKSRSILKEEENAAVSAAAAWEEGTTVIAMDSDDPFRDFRKSMEEMVEAHRGIKKDWESLEELLSFYLRVNGRNNHGFILGAFVDLLVTLAMAASSSSSSQISEKFLISPLMSVSSSSSSSNLLPCLSSSMEIEDITSLVEHHHHHRVFS